MLRDTDPRSDAIVARRRLPLAGALLRFASDERLIAQLRAGSEAAFEVIFDRHHQPLLGFCRNMLGSSAEAEDVVQDTFLAAYHGIARSDKPIVLRPWLYTIARHRCISMLRSRREQPVEQVPELATANLVAQVAARDDLRSLLADVARLPEAQRAALVLAELGQLSHHEIASVVGCPQLKVRALVFQARSNLAAARAARDTPCRDIREHIAMPDGGEMGRSLIRRHVAACEGCRQFRDQVRTQRRGFALLLPVAPSLGLKAAVLGAMGAGSGAGAVSGGALAGGSFAATALLAVAIVSGAGHGVGPPDRGARSAPPAAAASMAAPVTGGAVDAPTRQLPSPPVRHGAPSPRAAGPPGGAADDSREHGRGPDQHRGHPMPVADLGTPPPQQPADTNQPGATPPRGGEDSPSGDRGGEQEPTARSERGQEADGGRHRQSDDPERADKPEKPDKADRGNRADGSESPERSAKPDKPERPEQNDKADAPEQPQQTDKADKPKNHENTEPGEQPAGSPSGEDPASDTP